MNKITGRKVLAVWIICACFVPDAQAYVDPGAGSYLFQILIASVVGALLTVKIYWRKLTSFFPGRRNPTGQTTPKEPSNPHP